MIEARGQAETFRDAAENTLAIQTRANEREEALQKEVAAHETRLRSVEKRCVELLQVKMEKEKELLALQSALEKAKKEEEAMRETWEEMKKEKCLAVRRAEKSIQQVYEEKEEEVSRVRRRLKEMEEEAEKEAEEAARKWEAERVALEGCVEAVKREAAEKEMKMREAKEKELKEVKEAKERELRELREAKEKELKEVKEAKEKEVKELTNNHRMEVEAKLKELQARLEKEAEERRSALEMKMVRSKEKALSDQQTVFQRELGEGVTQAEARETALRAQCDAEKRELQAVLEKEGEEYRRVISDLRGSLAAKDVEMKQKAQLAAELQTKVQEQEETLQALQRALVLGQGTRVAEGDTGDATKEEIPAGLLERAKEQEKERKELIQKLEKEVEEKEKAMQRLEKDLEAERTERRDESKRGGSGGW